MMISGATPGRQMYIPQIPFTTHIDPMVSEEAFSATTTPSKLPDRMASK
jgi:hypothetical protein